VEHFLAALQKARPGLTPEELKLLRDKLGERNKVRRAELEARKQKSEGKP
jgi:hypothetical protein